MEYQEDSAIENPNLYITLLPMGGIWSSNVYPWQEALPWTLSAPN